ncbi:MAG: hypothetical protein JWP87_95 [Labilithrix sp.]|nr:hypothetical protein [Labilithrix sp.]
MILSWRRLAVLTVVPVLLATACSSSVEPDADSSADEINYRSTAGQEFALSTNVTFKLSAETQALSGDAKDAAVLVQAQTLRDSVLDTITSELDKLWPEEERTSNAGVAIQYRQASAALADLKALPDGSYGLTVSGEFAGIKDLERRLPMKTAVGKTFLPINADLGEGSKELQVFITPVARSLNAYPKYLEMFADGLDIGVHLGGDHNTPPQDINHARSVYDDLVASGFRSPVAKFEDLKIDSGPLTSAIKVKGQDVPVRVRIVHADMSTPETRNLLVDAYKASAKDADVIIYDGHAGRRLDYSGVVLAYNPARSSIPANEFKTFETTDKQQVYLFNGCETYTGYADKLYENPKRKPENTDIITTGNFSAIQSKANQVISFIHSFIDQRSGAWIPRSWDSVLAKMNAVGERSWVHIYGVHGLDDNPKVSPLADVSKVGAACTNDSQCGAPDSRCIVVSASSKVCGVACADTAGCPTGTKCVLPRGRTSADDQQCSPQ